MIPIHRKNRINKIASFIANEFSKDNITSLEEIVEYEEIPLYLDHYEDSFDGMLLHDGAGFHIHINIDRGNSLSKKRGRFTLAHELGHFFIDEHRIGLKYGILEPHMSLHDVTHTNIIESEADYFASCLLMPAVKLRQWNEIREFSLEKILAISESFQVSVLATLLKFAEVGSHEIMVVVSENKRVKWFTKSKDFPSWPFRFKVGTPPPPTTVAGEFFRKPNSRYTTIEEVSPDDWFYPRDGRGNRKMYEQCYYSDSYGYVISLIWFD